MGDAGGHQSAGQGAEGLTVDGDAVLFVDAGETVNVLPVADGLLDGDVLGVGQVVGDAAAFVAGEAAGVGDLGEETGVGGAVTDLHGDVQVLDDGAAALHTVVDGREAVQQAALSLHGLADAVLGLAMTVLTGVAVNGGGEEVGAAFVLQELQELNVLLDESHAGAGLDQGNALLLGIGKLLAEDLVLGESLVVGKGLFQVNVLTGGPLGEDLRADALKLVLRDALILQFHRSLTPFS